MDQLTHSFDGHRPLVPLTLFFCLGILLEPFTRFNFLLFYFLIILLLIFAVIIKFRKGQIILFLLIFTGLGTLFSRNYQIISSQDIYSFPLSFDRKNPVWIQGIIISDVENRLTKRGEKTVFKMAVKYLKGPQGWQPRCGKVLVNIYRQAELSYGDWLILEGKLYEPFDFSSDSTSYRDYLYRQGIKLILSVKKNGTVKVLDHQKGNSLILWSLRTRERLRKILSAHLSSLDAGIMRAFLLGDRSHLSLEIKELFVHTGTAHILAISGFNIGIVAFLVLLFLKIIPIRPKAQYFLTIIFLVFYAILTGGQPSVVRATIMAVIFISSFLVEREIDILNSLAGAAFIILLFNPLALFDIGFQLSFISVLSIVFLYQPFLNVLFKIPVKRENKIFKFFCQSFAISLAAWIGVAGLIAYYFSMVTPITILANLFVVPLSSLLIALGLGIIFIGIFCPGLCFTFASCIKLVIHLMISGIYICSHLPGAYFLVEEVFLWQVIVYYISILLFRVLYAATTLRGNVK